MNNLLIARLGYYNQELRVETKILETLLILNQPDNAHNIVKTIEKILYWSTLMEQVKEEHNYYPETA